MRGFMIENIEQQIIETIRVMPEQQQLEALEYLRQKAEETKPKKRKLMVKLEELRKNVPEEAWAEVPKDSSLNVDHYLYGSPKKI